MPVTEQDNNQDPQQSNGIDASQKSNNKRRNTKRQVQAATTVTQVSLQEGQQKTLYVHPIQWAALIGIFFLIFVAIVGSIIAFCVTRLSLGFLLSSVAMLLGYPLYRIIKSIYPLSQEELAVEMVKVQRATSIREKITAPIRKSEPSKQSIKEDGI
jgi:hypothetical protein